MTGSVQQFSDWLAATPISTAIQNTGWIIPSVQTVHILAIAIVVSSALLVDLRILGLISPTESLDSVARRFLPWIWATLGVLLLSGTTLIVGEPGRSLQNPAFIAKMGMLAAVIVLTVALQRGLSRDSRYWEASTQRRLGAKLIAGVSLLLWMAIVFAGRWIAYISVDSA